MSGWNVPAFGRTGGAMLAKSYAVSVLLLTIVVVVPALGQWQPDQRLTFDPASSRTSGNNAWCVATTDDVVHAVWTDDRDGNSEIYRKRSIDGGVSWGSDTRLTNDAGRSECPSIAVAGSAVHVVWKDTRDGNSEIFYKRSIDGGVSWGSDTRLSVWSGAFAETPSVTATGAAVHVVWYRDHGGDNRKILYKRSIDAGASWGDDTQLTNEASPSEFPSVAATGEAVHVVWRDLRDGNWEVYYKRSIDGGETWGDDTRLTNDGGASMFPSVAATGADVHVVWNDDRDGNTEVYYKRSADGGAIWDSDTRLTTNLSRSEYPLVAVAGAAVHAVWTDDRDGNSEVYHKRSIDGGEIWGDDTRLTNDGSGSMFPSVATTGAAVHVVWTDNRDGNLEIYCKRNPTGSPVTEALTADIGDASFAVSPSPLASGFATLRYGLSKAGAAEFSIYNVTGQRVMARTLAAGRSGSVDLDLRHLSNGVYLVKLSSEGFASSQKFIVQR
jgi:hypothetical protein